MTLLAIWKAQPEIATKRIDQLLKFTNDGKLRDDSDTSHEFRAFLDQIPSKNLCEYARQCLEDPFPDSGMALQDIVNQFGKRLGFDVTFGRYRGAQKQIGNDGLWKAKNGHAIVVEVKTTDAYQIPLHVPVKYRDQLIECGQIEEDRCSTLYVVGRTDTEDLESQIRGSRHAWDIRLIGIEALSKLLLIRESADDPEVHEKIRNVLRPREFTRIDGIIDLVFTTTTEATKDDVVEDQDEDSTEENKGKKFTPVDFRDLCIQRLSAHLDAALIKQSAAIYSSADRSIGICCSMSREYKKLNGSGYWFAFHPGQLSALKQYPQALVAFACGSAEQILLIPLPEFEAWFPSLNRTITEDRTYWHVKFKKSENGWINKPRSTFPKRSVDKYLLR